MPEQACYARQTDRGLQFGDCLRRKPQHKKAGNRNAAFIGLGDHLEGLVNIQMFSDQSCNRGVAVSTAIAMA